MTESSLVISLFAFIFSLISVIIVIIKLGLSLGMEFVEKKEIRNMKVEIEKKLKKEWGEKLRNFISTQSQIGTDVIEEVTKEKIAELGKSVRHTQISSILLSVISKISSSIIKYVIWLFIITIGLILSIWFLITNPEYLSASLNGTGQNLWMIPVFIIIFLIAVVNGLYKNMKNYNSLRKQFYELGEDSSLTKAKTIFNSLEEKELIYG